MSFLRKYLGPEPSPTIRAPTEAAVGSGGSSIAFTSFGENAYEQANAPELYSKSGPARVNIHAIASRFASLNFRAVGSIGNSQAGRSYDFDRSTQPELTSHPILTLLDKGNERMPGWVVRYTAACIYYLLGDCRIVIERDGAGIPVEMWPVPATFVSMSRKTKGAFRVEIPDVGTWPEVQARDLLRFYNPDPVNPYSRASSFAEASLHEALAASFASQLAADRFKKQGIPSFLVGVEGANDGTLKRLETIMKSKFRGLMGGSQGMWVGHKIDVKPIDQSLTDLKAGDLRDSMGKAVGRSYGVPPELTGDVSNSNRATIEVADVILSRGHIVPMAELWCGMIDAQLKPSLPDIYLNSRIVYDSPVPKDKEFRLKVMQAQPYRFTDNEWREMAGMPKLEGGDELRPEPSANPFPDNLADDAGEVDRSAEVGETRQIGQVQARLPSSAADSVADSMTNTRLSKRFMERFGTRTASFMDRYARDANLPTLSGQARDRAIRKVVDETAKMVDVWADFTRKRVKAIVLDGIDKGASVEEIADRLEQASRKFQGGKALTIARTEVQRASQLAGLEVAEAAGVSSVMWLSQRDSRVRHTHVDLDGTLKKPGEKFRSKSGAEATHPGGFGVPAEDVNCRCVIVPQKKRESLPIEVRDELWAREEAIISEWVDLSLGDLRQDAKEAWSAALRTLKQSRTETFVTFA